MNWRNEEQYADYTAAEAMLRMLGPSAEESDRLDDEGCRLLIEAIVRQAVEDHVGALRDLPARRAACRLAETNRFFLSDYFRGLTGMDGKRILRLIRKEVNEE